jgi:hypothetical protein
MAKALITNGVVRVQSILRREGGAESIYESFGEGMKGMAIKPG